MNEIIPDILAFEDLDFDAQEVNRYVELLWFVRKSDAVFFGGQHSGKIAAYAAREKMV